MERPSPTPAKGPVQGAKLAQGSLPGGLWRRIAPGAWGSLAGCHWPHARSCADYSQRPAAFRGSLGPSGASGASGASLAAGSCPIPTKNHYKQQLGGMGPASPTNHHKGCRVAKLARAREQSVARPRKQMRVGGNLKGYESRKRIRAGWVKQRQARTKHDVFGNLHYYSQPVGFCIFFLFVYINN